MVFDDTYLTIEAISSSIYKEKSSKFLAFAIPVKSEMHVNEQLKTYKKTYYDANHHCFAYRLGYNKELFRYSDDGEPSGTAGRPIMGQLVSHDLTNVLILVVRYFGGTKLGTSGLINAYKTATIEAIANSKIVTKIIYDIYDVDFNYNDMNNVMKIIKEGNLKQSICSIGDKCQIRILVRKSKTETILGQLKKINGLIYNYIGTE